ncbi:trichohyalin-like isoform X24 [Mya arenaria]|uniref:trichohyalin-like isoform X24 n=1 Tax=Mya arenaria TaxID=6604 RepID=UPI0022E65236|nr:trichohyalin-like isoform X24 [Mya arenaria]
MAALAMDYSREPEMARFIDTHKFDQDMSTKRDKFGGGTSLPLNSDGYENKQQQLRDERHIDWMRQQEKESRYISSKQMPHDRVYYRVGTPEQGFPTLGSYEKQRQDQNLVRQKEYNDFLRKQKESEKQKFEARRQAQPTGAPAAGPQIDYDRNNEMAKQEDRKAYQDYMGKYQHPQNASQKPPINYEENRRVLNEERKRDYNQLMEKKAKEERYWAMRGRPVTPPGGLNIGSYERHQKESAEQKKKEYKEMLDQQTAEQLRMKAFERVAEVSPGHINYREDERPLVGSPRDVNYYLHEKEEKRDKFRHDLKAPRKREEYSPESHRNTQYPKADDQNLKAFIDVEREKRENQRQYAEELAQQQREHMYLKARQEPEVAVMDRSGVREQYLASKPPAGPGFRPRDEPTKQNPAFWNDGHRSRGPMSLDSNVPRSNMSSSSKMGTPLAFKTSEPQNRRPIPERPRHGQPPYHGERENDAEKVVYKAVDQVEPQGQEPRQGQGHPPQGQSQRGPGNLYSDEKTRTPPEWLKNDAYSNSLQRPVDSNQSVIGTPLAFKTPYRPIQQHPARPSPLPDNSYSQNQRPIYNELDPTSQRARSRGSPDQGRGSRRSYEAERRPGGQGQEEMNDKSPRRKKQSLYNDNEDVLAKRDKANKERQEEYNEYIKMKQNEERRRQEETRQPVGKPAERVRSPHYSSDDYESWRRKEQQKLGKEYQDYLKELDPSPRRLPKSPDATATSLTNVGSYDELRPKFESQRNQEYQEYLRTLPPMKKTGIIPKSTDVTLPVGQYEEMKNIIEKQRNREYNDLIKEGKIGQRTFREKIPTPPNLQGLPIGQNRYEPMHKAMEYQRNKEYNEFIQKKYGGRTISSRSEPPREKPSDSSFYYGNELEHEEKRKMLDHERRNEYNSFVRERVPPPSKNYNVPTDADSGLPIGQQHHEAWKKFLREQRNKEYNQLVEVKGHDHRNRDWNFEQNGILELRGDDANQSRQRELRAERQKDYNDYKTQMKPAPNHDWPTPNYEKPFITRGAYDGLKELYDEERRKDLQDALERRREHFLPEIKPRVMSEPIRGRYVNQNPMVDALGRYEDYRQKLNADRKQEWMTSLEQARSEEELHDHQEQDKPSIAGDESPLIHSLGKYETEIRQKVKDQRRKDFVDFTHDQPIYTARSTVRENLMPNEASYETPLVSHMGKYDDEREKFREERHEDLLHYSKEHPLTTRSGVHENLMPHEAWAEIPLVSYMGKYDDEKIRFRNERNKDFKLYSEQRRTQLRDPHDHFVFPTVAAAERPIVAHMGRDVEQRKVDLRSERQRDYEQYQQQHKSQSPGRRHDFVDTAQGPYNGGLFQGLGQRGPDKDGLNQQRKHEYNERLDQQYGKERPHGRPNWVKETLPNNVDRGRSPQRNPGPGGADQYSRMLEEKRREEASRRRFDDPEFQGRLPQSRERDNANKQ